MATALCIVHLTLRMLAQGLVDQFVAERAVESLQELLVASECRRVMHVPPSAMSRARGARVAVLNADVPLVQSRPVRNAPRHAGGAMPNECSRAVLQVLVHMARSIEKLDNEALRQVAETAIERLRERLVSFEEPDALFRDSLSEVYMALGRYTDAAKVVIVACTLAAQRGHCCHSACCAGADWHQHGERRQACGSCGAVSACSRARSITLVPPCHRNYSAEEKANRYVKIAELFLQARTRQCGCAATGPLTQLVGSAQDDETVDAEIYLNRASVVMSEVSDWALELRYKARPVPAQQRRAADPLWLRLAGVARTHPGREAQVHRGRGAVLSAQPTAPRGAAARCGDGVSKRAHPLAGACA